MDRPKSPRIQDVSWGRIEVEGYEEPFKDAKLFPGGARGWDWSETGTGHEAGIQPADVQELLDEGAEAVVLSCGMEGRLQIDQETLRMLEERDIEVHVLETKAAVERYNSLREDIPVGGLFHYTC